jgi:hypothetical protein
MVVGEGGGAWGLVGVGAWPAGARGRIRRLGALYKCLMRFHHAKLKTPTAQLTPPTHPSTPHQAINGGKATWFGIEIPFDLNTLLAIEFVSMAAAESRRGDETDATKRIYPGALTQHWRPPLCP